MARPGEPGYGALAYGKGGYGQTLTDYGSQPAVTASGITATETASATEGGSLTEASLGTVPLQVLTGTGGAPPPALSVTSPITADETATANTTPTLQDVQTAAVTADTTGTLAIPGSVADAVSAPTQPDTMASAEATANLTSATAMPQIATESTVRNILRAEPIEGLANTEHPTIHTSLYDLDGVHSAFATEAQTVAGIWQKKHDELMARAKFAADHIHGKIDD